jgi:hypothetical protein
MPIPFNVNIFERGAGGIPTTTFVEDIGGRIDSCVFTITDKFGFETLTTPLTTTFEEALIWLHDGLGRGVELCSPDAAPCWQGRLIGVEGVFGLDQRARSFDGMANRVRVRYVTVLGTAGTTALLSDTASQALYGVKDVVLSADRSDLTEADYFAAVELARRKNPRTRPTTQIATGDQGGVSLRLLFEGWYGALDWVTTSITTTTKVATTTQIPTLLTAYNADNDFFDIGTEDITVTGPSVTQFAAPDTTYREKIESLMRHGTGTAPVRYGVYDDRRFTVAAWAGSTPDVITYQGAAGDSALYDASGNAVDLWRARPNAMYQNISLLDPAPIATAQDEAARFYVARTVCAIEGDRVSLSLEPEDPDDLSAIFIRRGYASA